MATPVRIRREWLAAAVGMDPESDLSVQAPSLIDLRLDDIFRHLTHMRDDVALVHLDELTKARGWPEANGQILKTAKWVVDLDQDFPSDIAEAVNAAPAGFLRQLPPRCLVSSPRLLYVIGSQRSELWLEIAYIPWPLKDA